MAIEIRSPGTDDADALGRVHVRAWQSAYRGGLMPDDYLESLSADDRASMWRSALERPPRARSTRLVAAVDGEVVGFALVGPAEEEPESETGELYAMNVDPDHWGTGVGAALMTAVIDTLRETGWASAVLWVHPANERARTFYARFGWVDDEVARGRDVLGVEVPEARLSLDVDA